MLVTHRGLSGPAILQISSYWQHGQPLHIDLVPDCDMAALLDEQKTSKKLLSNFLTQWFPKSFSDVWCAQLTGQKQIENKPLNQYNDKQRKLIPGQLHHSQIIPSGTAGYNKAEVTCGGIDTRALSSKTMECIEVPGLYFIGEVVDVTGQLGGYNFQWAWASGYAAGQAVGCYRCRVFFYSQPGGANEAYLMDSFVDEEVERRRLQPPANPRGAEQG